MVLRCPIAPALDNGGAPANIFEAAELEAHLTQLKRVAAQFGVHVMVVAHPTKMRQQDDGTFDVPSLYSISDSANWANKADLGAVVYRLDENLTLFRTLKSRYHDQIGKPGQRKLLFSNHSGRFHVQVDEIEAFLD